MYLGQIPFFPAERASYDVAKMEASAATLFQTYPETLRCLGCGACTKACPQELDVKGYMAAAMRGDIADVAAMSFDCIMCGLCAARCPAEEPQYNIAILARRLYGRYLAPRSEHLYIRVAEIEDGQFDADLTELKSMESKVLRDRYEARDIEPK
jgi:ferredoxin